MTAKELMDKFEGYRIFNRSVIIYPGLSNHFIEFDVDFIDKLKKRT